jgi:hypothetical protein
VPISRRPSPLLEQGDPRGALFADTDWDLRELATGHWAMSPPPSRWPRRCTRSPPELRRQGNGYSCDRGCRLTAESRDSGWVHDRGTAERWISAYVQPRDPIEIVHERPWSTVLRVPLIGGAAWFKACSPVQAFEPRLSAELFARWPDRVSEVLAYDDRRAWLLLGDAGMPIGAHGNPPEAWLEVLPAYAELQGGEAAHAKDHIAHDVPSLPASRLPDRYAGLLEREMPLEPDELARLADFLPRYEQLCVELAAGGLPPTVQHDDLHMGHVYELNERLRLLD